MFQKVIYDILGKPVVIDDKLGSSYFIAENGSRVNFRSASMDKDLETAKASYKLLTYVGCSHEYHCRGIKVTSDTLCYFFV